VHLYHNGCCGDGEATHIEISNDYIKFNDRYGNELELSYEQWLEIEAILKDNISKADELLNGLYLSDREKGQLKFYINKDQFNILN